jgi:uncharacterized protein YrrD
MFVDVGFPVYGRQGKQVGEVQRLVLDGTTLELSHLTVAKGWLLPRDIVVPVSEVDRVEDGVVWLRINEDQLQQYPDFIEEHYVAPSPGEPVLNTYRPGSYLYTPLVPPLGVGWYMPAHYGLMASMPNEIEKNVPDGSVTLSEGTDVWAGQDQVGTVAGVRLHPRTNQVTHIVVSKGWLFPEEQVLPIDMVGAVDEQGLHLRATAAELHAGVDRERA